MKVKKILHVSFENTKEVEKQNSRNVGCVQKQQEMIRKLKNIEKIEVGMIRHRI